MFVITPMFSLEEGSLLETRNLESFQLNCRSMPQRSVLGPLLYIIYVSDFCETLRYYKYNYYADDLMIYIHTKPSQINEALSKIRTSAK